MGRIAVVGSGYWGKNLVRNFASLGALECVCDNNPRTQEQLRLDYPGIPVAMDLDRVLEGRHGRIDGVALATPAETHFELASKCIAAGKHVFVEKPLALTVDEGQQLVSLAAQHQKSLMVGHILHYHPAVTMLKRLIDGGELGKIQYVYSNRLNIGKIRAEENILWSFAPHDISIILMLLGEIPQEVLARGAIHLQKDVFDTSLSVLSFRSGTVAHIFVSWLHPFKEQKLVVVGDKKMAVFNDVGDDKLLLYPHEIKWLDRIPVATKAMFEKVEVEMVEPLKAECEHFIQCIDTGARPKTDGQEGLRVLKVLAALQESLNRNGNRVQLDPETVHVRPAGTTVLAAGKSETPGKAANMAQVHESSYMDDDVLVGDGTKIWHFCHVLKGSRIGADCSIGQNVMIGPDVIVGDRCKVQNNVSIYKGVTLEDEVFCGPSMVFTNVYNPRSAIPRMEELRPTNVLKGATIGANATVVCGITIGRYAFIGAGAVVLDDVPDFALMVGNPARHKGWMCKCGIRLNVEENRIKCPVCESCFRLENGSLCIEG